MKKLISIILIMCMTAGLLSGCSLFNSTSLAEDIVNIQTAGYLYTPASKAGSRDETIFLKERKKAIYTMISFIEKGAKKSYAVTDGLSKYEDNLLNYINKIDDADDFELSILGGIVEKIVSYKVIIASYEDELKQYIKMKPGDDASEAIINTYKSNAFYKLVQLQGEYIAWIINNTASISAILEDTNKRQSEKLTSTSQSIYSKKIYDDYTLLLSNYESASLINSAIISADFYVSEIYLAQALVNIENSEPGQALTDLKEMYEESMESRQRPSILKQIPEKKSSLSLARKVYAETDIAEFGSFIGFLEYYTTIGLPDADNQPQPKINEENFSEKVNKEKEEVKNIPKKMTANADANSDSVYSPSKDAKNAAQTATENANLRSIRMLAIKAGQKTIQGFNIVSTNLAYSTAIKILSGLIANGKTMSEDEKQAAVALIKNSMTDLIGSDKESFVNLIVSTNAEDIYSTFEEWRDDIGNLEGYTFTKDDLVSLLEKMGMDVKNPDTVVAQVPDSSPSPTNQNTTPPNVSATTAPIPSQTAEPTSQPTDTEIVDNYGVAEITILWQTLKEFNRFIGNAEAMYMLFGWTDLLDYSQYEKKEITNKDGELTRIQYLMNSSDRVGWQTSFYDTYIEYDYKFPDSNDAGITIYRAGTPEKSYISMIKSYNNLTDRNVDIRFNDPDDTNKEEIIKSVSQYQSDKKDGLNSSAYNSNPYFILYDMEEILESYVYKDGILIREVSNTKRDGKIESHIIEYFDSGKIKRDFTEWDGEEDGTYTSYYESGIVSRYVEYLEGKLHGVFIDYYENSEVYEHRTYQYGVEHGPSLKYQSDDPHILRYEGAYSEGELTGLWKGYSPQGTLTQETEYVNGVKHGIYRDYIVDDEFHTTTYHSFGQYEDGKKTGQWELGLDNKTPIQINWYENDIRIWSQYTDSNLRNYYDESGTVIRTEDMN